MPQAVIVDNAGVKVTDEKNGNWRKKVTVAVTVVLVTAIVTAGIVTCAVLFSNTQTELIKRTVTFKDPSGKEQSEDVEVDPQHNTATYTVHTARGQMTAFNDYNKMLGVIAVHGVPNPYCLLFILNVMHSPDDFLTLESGFVANDTYYLSKNEKPIPSPFLPPGSPDLCDSVDVYGATISGYQFLQEHHRSRRIACCRCTSRPPSSPNCPGILIGNTWVCDPV